MHVPEPAPSNLVGRDRERAVLRDRLDTALDRHGRVVLVGGEAGIGKTALAEALGAEATQRGALVLSGRCYDRTETPPYGPWREILADAPSVSGMALSAPFAADGQAEDVPNQMTLFVRVRDFLIALAAHRPLLLVLEDLHWADPASLDLLRFLGRDVRAVPLLILGTYRGDELGRAHPLAQILPALVREADVTRMNLTPLTSDAIRSLVHTRYALADADEQRLAAYLTVRSEGNALFCVELLRTLEEERFLCSGERNWALGDLTRTRVPLLLRQVIDARLARLGAEAERLLAIAAMIGSETPFDLWAAVSDTDEEVLLNLAERAVAARVLDETADGNAVRFAHALIRDALYEGVLAARRRRFHCQIGEAIAAMPDAHPDIVAYHFRMAGDARATEWLVRAGWWAYYSFAYQTAQARFTEALPHIAGVERVRTLMTLAALHCFSDRGARYAEDGLEAARGTDDEVLTAIAQFRRGVSLGYRGRIGEAVAVLEEASAVLDMLPDDLLLSMGSPGLSFAQSHRKQHLAYVFACCGQWRKALALMDAATLDDALIRISDTTAVGPAAVMYISLFLGRPDGVRRSLDVANVYYTTRADDAAMPHMGVCYEHMLLLPYLTDNRLARKEIDELFARTLRQAERALGDVPPLLNHCPRLVVEGRWDEARALWAQRREHAVTHDVAWNLSSIGTMARARGERDAAWTLVREGLPDGPLTEPGTAHFVAMELQCLAARLALDEGDHAAARTWMEAHDRWLAWAGPEVRWGRADGHQAWAEYFRAECESEAAQCHAERALAHASEPRQPLLLLAAHRLLGELATEAGDFGDATMHFDSALAIADACAAPYERALTLLGRAALYLATGRRAEVRALLGEAREICEPLDAKTALARADALAARLAAARPAPVAFPAGLSAREVEVLHLVAAGLTDVQVAERLSLSPRTVGRHLTAIYRKLGVASRAAATRFAVEQRLT